MRLRSLIHFSRLALALFPLLGSGNVLGQAPDSEPTISTDRPSVANSSVVVPKGYLQFENGLLITKTQSSYVFDLPETNLRFGLLDKTELRFSVPDYYHTLSGNSSISGFGDSAIGVKQQFGPLPENWKLHPVGCTERHLSFR